MECPHRKQLERFADGDLPDDELEAIGDHLEQCKACGQLLAKIEGRVDSFLAALRQAQNANPLSTVGSDRSPDQQKVIAAAEHFPHQEQRIRCPHCHNPIALVFDSDEREITCPNCDSSFHVAAGMLPGILNTHTTTLGRYVLLQRVGIGAVGSVWKARDTSLNRIVALKIPRRGLDEVTATSQFIREARASAQLRHPNIVRVYEVASEGETTYIVSAYVDGITLADQIAAERPSARESAELCAQIARALHYAHESGIIHRDLKPSNILLDDSGQPLVTDFGLAKQDNEEITMTLEGQLLGTPAYMAPEQARGEGHTADRRSDVYSLGVILYELLTGERPFRGTSRMLLLQVLEDDPPAPRRLEPSVPRDLEAICLKCMEKNPSRRYQTAEQLASELQRFLIGLPVEARPVTAFNRWVRQCQRYPIPTTLAIALILSLALGAAISTMWAIRAHRSAVEQRAMLAEKEEILNGLQLSRASRLAQRDPIQAVNLLQDERDFPEHLRDFSWRYLRWLFQRDRIVLYGDDAVHGVHFSNDGRRLFTAHSTGFVRIWNPTTGAMIHQFRAHDLPVWALAVSSDGRLVATGSGDGQLKLWNTETFEQTASFPVSRSLIRSLSFGTDGSSILILGEDSEILVLDAMTGAVIRSLSTNIHPNIIANACLDISLDRRYVAIGTRGPGTPADVTTLILCDLESPENPMMLDAFQTAVSAVAFSSDGHRIAAASEGGQFRIWHVDGTELVKPVSAHPHRSVTSLKFSPDGLQLATADSSGLVRLWNPISGTASLVLRGHVRGVEGLSFTADSQFLASAALDGTTRIWDLRSDGDWRLIRFHQPYFEAVSADGELAAVGQQDGTIVVWKLDSDEVLATLSGHDPAACWKLEFSPDAALLASAGWDGTVRLWDLAEQREIHRWEFARDAGANGRMYAVAFANDGRSLAIGGGDGVVRICDVDNGQDRILGAHTDRVWDVAFSPDGQIVASASRDHTIKLWELNHWREMRTLRGHADGVYGVAFSPDGAWLASCGVENDRTVAVWETITWQKVHTLTGHGDAIYAVAFTNDSTTLASAGADGEILLWGPATGTRRAILTGHDDAIYDLSFTAGDEELVSVSRDNTVRLWPGMAETTGLKLASGRIDQAPKSRIQTISDRQLTAVIERAHSAAVSHLQFLPDGNELLSAGFDGEVRVWSIQPGELEKSKRLENLLVCSVAVSDDGRFAAWRYADNGHLLHVWNLQTGQLLDPVPVQQAIWEMQFLPHSTQLLTLGETPGLVAWDPIYLSPIREIAVAAAQPHSRWQKIAVSPTRPQWAIVNGSKICLASENDLRRSVVLGDQGGQVRYMEYAADGRRLFSMGDSLRQQLVVWDTETRRRLAVLSTAQEDLHSIARSPDGRWLAAGTASGAVCLWDTETLELVGKLRSDLRSIDRLCFSPDGGTLATIGPAPGEDDRHIVLWKMESIWQDFL